MSTSLDIEGPLKRGRYVHAAYDSVKGTWLYRNLMNMALLEADPELNQSIYELLNEPNRQPNSTVDAEVRDLLLEHRFLIERDIDELEVLEGAYLRVKTNPRIASLAIVTTLQCNLRCEYCYQEHVDDTFSARDEQSLLALMRRTVDDVREGRREPLKQFGITWWGGEPLLRIDLIELLSRSFVRDLEEIGANYYCYMSTNGVLLTEKNCRTLREAKLSRVQITIDGPEQFHDKQRFNVGGKGTYKAVLKGLHNAVTIIGDGRRFITLRVNVTPRMLGSFDDWTPMLDDLAPYKDSLGFHFNPAVPNEFYASKDAISNDEFFPAFEELKRTFRARGFSLHQQTHGAIPGSPYCGAIPDNNWIVLPGSRLTKCTDKFHDRTSDCGRLHEDGRMELWGRAESWLNYSPFKVEMCRDCSVLPICMGGCQIVPFGSKKGDRCFRKTVLEQSLLEDPKRNRNKET